LIRKTHELFPGELNLGYIWQFRFDSYTEARLLEEEFNESLQHNRLGGFDSTEWHTRQLAMLDIALDSKLPRPSTITEFLMSEKFENLIDLGGGPGWIWVYLLKTNQAENLSYFNVELAGSRLAFDYLTKELPRMKFVELGELIELKGARNLLYANSVLQYFESNSELLKLIELTDPKCIILDDIAGAKDEFYSLQNYYGYLQVNRFANIDSTIQEITQMGYSLMMRRPYDKNFSLKMIPRIWLGEASKSDCEAPSSWTLAFTKN
jgi:putative methyltransferase (TIGR04325 family)